MEQLVSCIPHARSCIVKSSSKCPHFCLDQDRSKNLHVINKYLFSVKFGLLVSTKTPVPQCNVCSEMLGRLCTCIDCTFVGCFGTHINTHFSKTGHSFGLDVNNHNIYCHKCGDYFYNEDCDFIVCSQYQQMKIVKDSLNNTSEIIAYQWIPSDTEQKTIKQNATSSEVSSTLLGLRGLINLGNTCFMNCILQAFLINPIMRNYFLSDSHNRYSCDRKDTICLACEMEILFSEMFSGSPVPYTPAQLLYSIWKYSNYFAGYEQQDAHEFLISSLNAIHSHSAGMNDIDCKCIIHSVFGGVLRSDVTCAKCQYKSSAYDPFFDISVDIPKTTESSLQECLSNFTQAERLAGGEKFQCSKCNLYQESIKQFSIQVLPAVICFHFKRFEQKFSAPSKKSSFKVDTFVSFPLELNMQPYTSSGINSDSADSSHPEEYLLFAVVNHHGTMENGHYTAFVRHPRTMWVKCDDAFITKTSSQSVLESQGYMLFYIRKHLVYGK